MTHHPRQTSDRFAGRGPCSGARFGMLLVPGATAVPQTTLQGQPAEAMCSFPSASVAWYHAGIAAGWQKSPQVALKATALPKISEGSAPASPLPRSARHSLAIRPTWSLTSSRSPSARNAASCRCPRHPPRSAPTEVKVLGRGSQPSGLPAFPRALNSAGYALHATGGFFPLGKRNGLPLPCVIRRTPVHGVRCFRAGLRPPRCLGHRRQCGR